MEMKVSRTLHATLDSSLLLFTFSFFILSVWVVNGLSSPQILPFRSPVLGPRPRCPAAAGPTRLRS